MAASLLRLVPALFAIEAILVVVHLATDGNVRYWNLDKEHNLPTWFSGVQLVLVGLVCLDGFDREQSLRSRLVPPAWTWCLLASFFVYLSVDEVTVVHEAVLRNEVRDLLPPDSLWVSLLPWQIVFAPLLLPAAVLLLGLFLNRFAGLRRVLVPGLAGLGCWGGAVLSEGLAKPVFMARGLYVQEVALEEGLEMVGATLLLLAFCRYAAALADGVTLQLEVPAQRRRLLAAAATVLAFCLVGAGTVAAVSLANPGWLYRHNGGQFYKRERYREAIIAYRKALEHDPKDAAALRGIARAEAKRHDYAASLAAYDEALAASPSDARLWNGRGVALHNLERYDEAVESYRRALKLRSRYAKALVNMGIALERRERPEEARESYRRALEVDPGYDRARERIEKLGPPEDSPSRGDRPR